jgi:hypothetical protein
MDRGKCDSRYIYESTIGKGAGRPVGEDMEGSERLLSRSDPFQLLSMIPHEWRGYGSGVSSPVIAGGFHQVAIQPPSRRTAIE